MGKMAVFDIFGGLEFKSENWIFRNLDLRFLSIVVYGGGLDALELI